MSSRVLLVACGAAAVLAVVVVWLRPVGHEAEALPSAEPTLRDGSSDAAWALELRRRDETIESLNARIGALELRIAELSAALERRETPDLRSAARSSGPTHEEPAEPGLAESPSAAAARWLARVGGDAFAGMTEEQAKNLRELDLRGVKISDADLALLEGLPNLRKLNLRGTAIGDGALASVGRLPQLEALDLRSTGVSGDGLACLGSATLKALHLTQTNVSEADLYRMPWLPRLEVLKLNNLAVGDAAVDVIAHYPTVRHLEIDGTRITDEGLRRLVKENSALERIELRGTPVTPALLDELAAAHPGVTFVRDIPGIR